MGSCHILKEVSIVDGTECHHCNTLVSWDFLSKAVPHGVDPSSDWSYPWYLCPTCIRLPIYTRVALCDACLTYQPVQGGSTGALPVACLDDGAIVTESVIWICTCCRAETRVARVAAGLSV